MQVFLVASLTLINLLLWVVFFVRFKKLFSIDGIMNEFRTGMERLLNDAQNQTAFSINIIEEKIKELKAVTAEAERKLAVLRRDVSLTEQSALLKTQLSSKAPAVEKPKSKRKTPVKAAAEKYKKHSLAEDSYIDENAAYALTGLFRENAERSLFEEGQSVTVNNSGDSYGKIPLVKPKIVVSDSPIVPKKSFMRQVKELSALGKTVDEIAAETTHSTTEVQLVLDML